MPHNEGLGPTPPGGASLPGHPITITGDLTMNVPEPHSMVPVGRFRNPNAPEQEQQLRLFTLIGVDNSPTDPTIQGARILRIEIRVGKGRPQEFQVSNGDCEIKIFFIHPRKAQKQSSARRFNKRLHNH